MDIYKNLNQIEKNIEKIPYKSAFVEIVTANNKYTLSLSGNRKIGFVHGDDEVRRELKTEREKGDGDDH